MGGGGGGGGTEENKLTLFLKTKPMMQMAMKKTVKTSMTAKYCNR